MGNVYSYWGVKVAKNFYLLFITTCAIYVVFGRAGSPLQQLNGDSLSIARRQSMAYPTASALTKLGQCPHSSLKTPDFILLILPTDKLASAVTIASNLTNPKG